MYERECVGWFGPHLLLSYPVWTRGTVGCRRPDGGITSGGVTVRRNMPVMLPHWLAGQCTSFWSNSAALGGRTQRPVGEFLAERFPSLPEQLRGSMAQLTTPSIPPAVRSQVLINTRVVRQRQPCGGISSRVWQRIFQLPRGGSGGTHNTFFHSCIPHKFSNSARKPCCYTKSRVALQHAPVYITPFSIVKCCIPSACIMHLPKAEIRWG